jgi:selenocysteine lyase/cysteine desulfurase
MNPPAKYSYPDAIYFSPHKFLGGPGTPGVLIFKKALYKNAVPDGPGGGTVRYSNPWGEREYVDDIELREDGGTPPFLQAIRTAMCIRLKETMGIDRIQGREEEMVKMILPRLQDMKHIRVLEGDVTDRLGVFAFVVDGAHYNLVVRLLNDRFGIQTRGGCSCAGPYGHLLLNVDRERSHAIKASIAAGDLSGKPGWVRLSVHPTMTNAEIAFILDAIAATAANFRTWAADYQYDAGSNEYRFRGTGYGRAGEGQIQTSYLNDILI